MTIPTRKLGRTGVDIPILGLGAMDTPGSPEAMETLAAAAEAGVRFVDTAREYAGSEHLIGRFLREYGSNPFYLASKTFARTADGAQREVDRSLSVLGVPRIDLYQLHDVSTGDAWDAVMAERGALEGLKVAQYRGLVGQIGLSTHDLAIAQLAIASGDFDTIMLDFSAFAPESRSTVQDAAVVGLGVIVMRPVGGSGRASVLRNRKPASDELSFERLLDYVWSEPAVSLAIPGTRYPDRVRRNATAAANHRPLSEAACRALEATAEQFYEG
ncbi:MAG: aldo/keto reductase [Dehalococcoidia bacterium]